MEPGTHVNWFCHMQIISFISIQVLVMLVIRCFLKINYFIVYLGIKGRTTILFIHPKRQAFEVTCSRRSSIIESSQLHAATSDLSQFHPQLKGLAPSTATMATADPSLQDPLLLLRRAIASSSLPTPTTSSELSTEHATEDLAQATHLFFSHPTPLSLPLNTPTRFISATLQSAVDLRSIFFAWKKQDVAIPEYFAAAQELNETLKQKEAQDGSKVEEIQTLVFVERTDLITWLEGASDVIEYIKPLEGAAAAAEAAAAAAGSAQADASAGIAAGAKAGASAPTATTGAHGSRAQKPIDPKLQEIYNGERKTGDRNSVLRGIKETVSLSFLQFHIQPRATHIMYGATLWILMLTTIQDFSHVRKSSEAFLDRGRSRPGQPTKPGSKALVVPTPSAGLSAPSRKSNSRPDPIILLSPSASSLIRMSNIKSFLQDGVFVPPDHPTLSMATEANFMELRRPLRIKPDPSNPNSVTRSSRPTKFILVDGTSNFKPEYWSRLVAVFTTGQTWQFKSYKWSSPPDLFKHATGIYVGWRGEEIPSTVKGWGRGVDSFGVERWDEKGGVNGTGRWRDREIVEGIWTAIEEGMRLRGWASK